MENVIDIRTALEHLGTGWQFGGSVTANTESAWNAVVWEDERTKPSWGDICVAYAAFETKANFDALRSVRDNRIQSVGWMRERHTDEIALGTEPTLTPEQYTALLTYIQALRDLPAQPGAPWDGGGELTPWPEMPSVG